MRCHRGHRPRDVILGVALAEAQRVLQAQTVGHVSVQRVVRGCLIGEHVRSDPTREQRRQHVCGIRLQPDGPRRALGGPPAYAVQRFVDTVGGFVKIARRESPRDAARIHFDNEGGSAVHGRGERLGAAHAPEAGGDDHLARQRAAEVSLRNGGERLVSPLHNPLAADVDPASGGHLPVHRQPAVLELPERVP